MKLNWLAALGGMALTACTSDGDKVTDKPLNIVLINLDDAGNGDFSFKGAVGYETPNIDCLAAEGMSMTNFYAVQPISGASARSILAKMEWNVPIQSARASGPTKAVMRSCISRAALLVKVRARMRKGSAPDWSKWAMR